MGDAGREVAGIGKRYFGDAVAMWAFPEAMLGTLVLYLALVWTTLMGAGTWLFLLGDPQGQNATVAVSAAVFSVTLLVLSFFSGVVLDAVKAVFVCYCLDKTDTRSAARTCMKFSARSPWAKQERG